MGGLHPGLKRSDIDRAIDTVHWDPQQLVNLAPAAQELEEEIQQDTNSPAADIESSGTAITDSTSEGHDQNNSATLLNSANDDGFSFLHNNANGDGLILFDDDFGDINSGFGGDPNWPNSPPIPNNNAGLVQLIHNMGEFANHIPDMYEPLTYPQMMERTNAAAANEEAARQQAEHDAGTIAASDQKAYPAHQTVTAAKDEMQATRSEF